MFSKPPNPLFRSNQNQDRALIQTWCFYIAIATLLTILICTLFPFTFKWQEAYQVKNSVKNITFQTNAKDIIGNILLFAPLGFGITGLVWQNLSRFLRTVFIITCCGILSGIVEILQLFLLERTSSGIDVLLNSTGGLLGSFIFYRWGIASLTTLNKIFKKHLTIRNLILVFTLYSILILSFSVRSQKTITIQNWRNSFPLAIGNSPTGESPWQGQISQVWISDQFIRFEEARALLSGQAPKQVLGDRLLTFFQLDDQDNRQDQAGHLSDLNWQGTGDESRLGVFTGGNSWLQTTEPATPLIRKLKRKDQFSIGVSFQTSNIGSTQPARILSLSSDDNTRNFSLDQEQKRLTFRMRMKFSEKNRDTEPELRIPRVFVDTAPHQAIITYTGEFIRIYLDDVKRTYTFELSPVFMMSKLQDLWFSQLDTTHIRRSKFLYYSMVFAPLGAILGVMTIVGKNRFQTVILTSIGFVIPPIALQYIFIGNDEWRRFNQANLQLSFLILAAAMILVRVHALFRAKS